MLSEGEMHVGALCSELGQSQPAVSHHLALMRHGNIITPRRQGKNNFYSLTETGEGLADLMRGSSAAALISLPGKPHTKPHPKPPKPEPSNPASPPRQD
jgi:DNA-binding transcriptional ArsR family regulator